MEIMQATLPPSNQSKRPPMRTVVPLLGCALISACTASSEEVGPPKDELYFPTGMALSPDNSVAFVVNANSELRYNSGSISVFGSHGSGQTGHAFSRSRQRPRLAQTIESIPGPRHFQPNCMSLPVETRRIGVRGCRTRSEAPFPD